MANTKSPSLIDRHIGSRIRMRRIMVGMSQEKLGEKLGITFQQIQKYEKGTNRVGSGRLQEIGSVLGVPPSFFFEGQEGGQSGERQASPFEDLMAHKDSLQLLQAFNAISDPNVRQALVNMARALAGSQAAEDEAVSQPFRRTAVSHSS